MWISKEEYDESGKGELMLAAKLIDWRNREIPEIPKAPSSVKILDIKGSERQVVVPSEASSLVINNTALYGSATIHSSSLKALQ
jgi:hypothetical protein